MRLHQRLVGLSLTSRVQRVGPLFLAGFLIPFNDAARADLIGHWRFDETEGTVASDSANGNDALYENVQPDGLEWQAGRIGGAARLSDLGGGEYFSVNAIPQMAGAASLTISVWIDPDPNENSSYRGLFMTRTASGSENWGIALENLTSPYHIDSRTLGSPNQLDSSDAIRDQDGWRHVAFVWDAFDGSRKIYIDGTLDRENTGATDLSFLDSGIWFIGFDDCCGGGRRYHGGIDDLAVWDQPLSAAEIAVLAGGVPASDLDTSDSDSDGLPDIFEDAVAFLNSNDPSDARADQDQDGLLNIEEFLMNTDLDSDDTDSDGLNDGDEVFVFLTDPKIADTDGDGINDGEELVAGEDMFVTDPLNEDSDGDVLTDGEEIAMGTDPTDPLSPAPPDPVEPGLIGYWPLDEVDGVTSHDRVGGNHGVWQNGDGVNLAWTEGQIGGAADLSDLGGDNFFRIESIDQLLGAAGLTVTAWIDPDPHNGYNGIFMTRVLNSRVDNSWGLAIEGADGSQNLDTRVDGPGIDSPPGLLAPDAGWIHIALVWDGATQTHVQYVNGLETNQAASGAGESIQGVVSGPWFIGYDDCCGGGRDFDGRIDDVALWNQALDADAILSVYENGLAGIGAGPESETPALEIVGALRVDGDAIQLRWISQAGAVYTVLASDDVSSPVSTWTVLDDAISSQGAETEYTTPSQAGNARRFFVVMRSN